MNRNILVISFYFIFMKQKISSIINNFIFVFISTVIQNLFFLIFLMAVLDVYMISSIIICQMICDKLYLDVTSPDLGFSPEINNFFESSLIFSMQSYITHNKYLSINLYHLYLSTYSQGDKHIPLAEVD